MRDQQTTRFQGMENPRLTPEALRRQAEKIAMENTAKTQENIEALSSEEIRQIIHEICVHQTELEMHNRNCARRRWHWRPRKKSTSTFIFIKIPI